MIISYMAAPACRKLKGVDAALINTIHKVCDKYDKLPDEIFKTKNCRKREYVEPRQVIMTLSVLELNKTLCEVAGMFDKNHATVLHAIDTVENLKDTSVSHREKWGRMFDYVDFPERNKKKPNRYAKRLK